MQPGEPAAPDDAGGVGEDKGRMKKGGAHAVAGDKRRRGDNHMQAIPTRRER
jgi:hypothetical protein